MRQAAGKRRVDLDELGALVGRIVATTPAYDIHTHLYDPKFGGLLLWGIDELLTYHYLIAETLRYVPVPYADFWGLSKAQQADLVWQTLFVERTPMSEACRGVVTTLSLLGLDPRVKELTPLRRWFAAQKPEVFVGQCLEIAKLRAVCMTNSPFDPEEVQGWLGSPQPRWPRFVAALRIDPLLLAWSSTAAGHLRREGYEVQADLSGRTFAEVRRFLSDWSKRIDAKFLMVSLPPDFAYPSLDPSSALLTQAVLPHCREFGLPFAVMPGVRRQVNPQLKMAGDGMGRSDLTFLANLCSEHSGNRVLATVLARENQHELCVLARKFRNLHPFGCWWFTNVPSIIAEMTRMRLELLGTSFTVQHSDARVMDQVLYKWDHTRAVVAPVLTEHYARLAEAGWDVTEAEIQRDTEDLFGGAFEAFSR